MASKSDVRNALVAVLFTDLVGSTELMTRLGQRAFDELRRRHFSALGTVVTSYGGDEVKNTGDGILAVFPSAAQAVDAAVALQRATLRQGGPLPVAIRIGLAVGDATLESGDVFGAPVVEAARLVAAANSGQILAGTFVAVAAGGRTTARFIDLGFRDLKGLPAPVPVCEVFWDSHRAASAPLPGVVATADGVFVGRKRELEALDELWKEVLSGGRRVALLAGEPGVGKTRLAAQLASRLHAEGAVVLAGRCDEDLGVPYQPFVEALRHFIEHSLAEELPGSLGRYGGELVRLVPELGERVSHLAPQLSSDPETERYRLFDAVASWLADASTRSPVLLVLDDLHWAAKPTLLLLRHVLRYADRVPLLVVATYRDTEVGRGHPLFELLADVRRIGGVERFSLAGLDVAEVGAFLDAAGDDRFASVRDEALPRAVWAETRGNPFFLTEVIRHLTESGAFERRGGRCTTNAVLDQLAVPEGVRDVVGRRLSRLSDDANRLLGTASVIGLEFETDLLQAASGFGEDVVLGALEEAVASRLVVEAPGARSRSGFAHALVRATLYDELTAGRRMALHRRVGEAIESLHAGRLDDYLPALAHHFSEAGGDPDKIIDYATRAGERAMAQLAFEAAVTHYEQALIALDAAPVNDGSRSGAVLLALASARARAGDVGARDSYRSAAELARRSGDAELLAGAALGMADLWAFSGSFDDTRISLLDEARQALGDTTSPVAAQLLARLATELYTAPGSWDRREVLSSQSIEVARCVGDPLTLAMSLDARNYTMWAPGGTAERLALGREIVDLALRGGDRELALRGHAWCQTALLELGDVAGLDVALADYERLAEELRQPRYRWYATTRRGMRALFAGDLDEGERVVRQGRDLGKEAHEADAENVFGAQMWEIWRERPCQEGVDVNDANWQAAKATVGPESCIALAIHLMALLLRLDTAPTFEVEAEIDDLVDFGLTTLDHTVYGMGWSVFVILMATAAIRRGRPEVADILYDLLLPYAGLNAVNCGAVTFDGSYSHHLGMLAARTARWDEAEEYLADAARTHERMGAQAFLGRTRLEWAAMLLTRRRPGDDDRARALLGQAETTARDLGLGVLGRRVQSLSR